MRPMSEASSELNREVDPLGSVRGMSFQYILTLRMPKGARSRLPRMLTRELPP